MRRHGTEPRGMRPLTRSPLFEGRFGRMFRKLPAAPALDPAVLKKLADSMREPEDASGASGEPGAPPHELDNPDIPAGYTYFGQFVDHDITFDPVTSFERQNDPDALVSFRSPRFDLDSVYGSGPEDEPFQYDKDEPRRFLIGGDAPQLDLPRNQQGLALIGDPRNDENIIVSGLHLVFLKLHNRLFEEVVADKSVPADRKFAETQQRVRWHYQWVVVHDYLRRLVGGQLLKQLFKVDEASAEPRFNLPNFRWHNDVYMPLEFSVAAFRFGHSQVRPQYNLNTAVEDRPIFIPGDEVGEFDDLRGFRPLPNQWSINWSMFLPIDGSQPQLSRRIDTRLSPGLFDLPRFKSDEPQSLAERNLLRGQKYCLPSGQDVAKRVHPPALTGAELGAPEPTPLWFYILKEAELSGGRRLGPVGAHIVAEVLLGLLKADPKAWVNVDPTWRPTIPSAKAGEFTLADLVKFADPEI
jgi:Animal haem peroxidase